MWMWMSVRMMEGGFFFFCEGYERTLMEWMKDGRRCSGLEGLMRLIMRTIRITRGITLDIIVRRDNN